MNLFDSNQSFSLQDVGQGRSWKYQIDWYKDPSLMQSIVIVRSKPHESANNLQITTWTAYSSILTIYAQVTMGNVGVVNAAVSLTLQLIHTNSTASVITEGWSAQMTDDGFGGNLFKHSMIEDTCLIICRS